MRRRKSYRRGKLLRSSKLSTKSGRIPSARTRVQFLRRPIAPLAQRLRVVLPFITTEVFAGGSAQSAFKRFRLAGPFDPDYETGGSFPLGYTVYQNLYDRAIVHAATVHIRAEIRDTTSVASGSVSSQILFGVHKPPFNDNDSSIAPFDTELELMQRAYQKNQGEWFRYRRLVRNAGAGTNAAANRGGGLNMKPIKFTFRNRALTANYPYGRFADDAGAESDPYGMTFSTAGLPHNDDFFTVFATSLPKDGDDDANIPYVYFTVVIRYDIEFFQNNYVL